MHLSFSIILSGPQNLRMWPNCEADGSEHTKTPSDTGERDEMDRFEKVCSCHDLLSGDMGL